MTYYYTDVGPGACGQLHQNNEYTVASESSVPPRPALSSLLLFEDADPFFLSFGSSVNTAQFNNGGVCGQTITITYKFVDLFLFSTRLRNDRTIRRPSSSH